MLLQQQWKTEKPSYLAHENKQINSLGFCPPSSLLFQDLPDTAVKNFHHLSTQRVTGLRRTVRQEVLEGRMVAIFQPSFWGSGRLKLGVPRGNEPYIDNDSPVGVSVWPSIPSFFFCFGDLCHSLTPQSPLHVVQKIQPIVSPVPQQRVGNVTKPGHSYDLLG